MTPFDMGLSLLTVGTLTLRVDPRSGSGIPSKTIGRILKHANLHYGLKSETKYKYYRKNYHFIEHLTLYFLSFFNQVFPSTSPYTSKRDLLLLKKFFNLTY